jgi:pSer/pThr/pTyr-binding forkhead associated (FHA) protein
MDHPSLSRHHAVVQFCRVPSADENDKRDVGWYLYDLDSTHGTWINKNKVPPRTYMRLRVGYVIKFGGSTRLFILQVSLYFQKVLCSESVNITLKVFLTYH